MNGTRSLDYRPNPDIDNSPRPSSVGLRMQLLLPSHTVTEHQCNVLQWWLQIYHIFLLSIMYWPLGKHQVSQWLWFMSINVWCVVVWGTWALLISQYISVHWAVLPWGHDDQSVRKKTSSISDWVNVCRSDGAALAQVLATLAGFSLSS